MPISNNEIFILQAYLTSGNTCSIPTNAASSSTQDPFVAGQDNLEELLSIDMRDFSQLQEESGNAADVDARITSECSVLFLEDGSPSRTIETDNHEFARPLPLSLPCLFCPRYFADKTIWRRHSLRHCKNILRCEKCKIRMRSANAIRKHYSYHHIPIPLWKQNLIMFHDTV